MIRAAALPDAMPPTDRPREQAPAHAHQRRTGLARLWHATGHSLAGLRAGWGEPAFRQEALLALVLLPAALWLGRTWVEVALLVGSLLLVLAVELLNSAVEAVIERYGAEFHELAGRAKDMGSAAVLMTMLNVLLCWGLVLGPRLM